MTLSKKHIAAWLLLGGILVLLIGTCTNLYWQKSELSGKLKLKTETAKKDSIKAVQKDIALKNVTHPESVYVDSARGMVYLAIRNDKLSDKPLPVIESTIPDTISLSASVKTTYREVTDTSKELRSLLNDLRYLADSLYSENTLLQAANGRLQALLAAKETPDTVRIKSAPYFEPPYVLGMNKREEKQLPKFQINANFQLSYNYLLHSPSMGIGTNIYLKHLRIYNGIYYSFGRQSIGGTSSAAYDFFNLYKSKK